MTFFVCISTSHSEFFGLAPCKNVSNLCRNIDRRASKRRKKNIISLLLSFMLSCTRCCWWLLFYIFLVCTEADRRDTNRIYRMHKWIKYLSFFAIIIIIIICIFAFSVSGAFLVLMYRLCIDTPVRFSMIYCMNTDKICFFFVFFGCAWVWPVWSSNFSAFVQNYCICLFYSGFFMTSGFTLLHIFVVTMLN